MKNNQTKTQTALEKMQEIAERLTSNTPQLAKFIESDSILKQKVEKKQSKNKKNEIIQSLGLKSEMTSNDYYQKCKELMTELTLSKDKNFKLENDIQIYKNRFVERQIQYRKIIQQLQQELKNKTSLDSTEKVRMQQIFDLHGKIQDNITAIQSKTSKILIQQESDIIRFFHKKINEIKQKFKQERINKGEKDQEYLQKQKQLNSQLDWIKKIAQKIDTQNQTLGKKYNQLKSEFQILSNDREMLIKELLMKKKKNAILTNQIQNYEKLLQEVSKDVETEQDVENVNNVKHQDIINSNKFKQIKETSKDINKEDFSDPKRALNTINTLKQTLAKEQKRVRQLKTLYMREIESKTQLEKILRKLVDDIKEEIMQVKTESRTLKRKEDEFAKEQREKLIERLLSNQKILTLIYDKTFYPEIKKMDLITKQRDVEEESSHSNA